MAFDPVILDKIYIHESQIKLEDIRNNYEYQYFNESFCKKCSNLPNRPNLVCQPCPHNLGVIKLWNVKNHNSGRWYGLPAGHIDRICRLFNINKAIIKDNRPIIKAKHRISFTGELWDGSPVNNVPRIDQISLIKQWLQYKNGIVRSPPRSGKSLLAGWLICQSGVRSIIFVHQDEHGKQFRKSFEDFTNTLELEQRLSYPIVSVIDNIKQLSDPNLTVAIINYQKLMYDHNRIIDLVNNKFSFAVINESHRASSTAYINVIGKLNCRWRMGLTATPNRRDHRHSLARDLIGPIVASSEVIAILPEIKIHWLNSGECSFKIMPKYVKWLGENKLRASVIINQAIDDLKEGHRVIIIPVDQLQHQKYLVDEINKRAGHYNSDPLKNLAIAFNAKSNREEVLKLIDSGRRVIFVPIRKMIKEDITFLWPSMLYCIVPISASKDTKIGSPIFEQLAFRIATPFKNKPKSVVRLFVDPGISHACAKLLFRYEIKPKLRQRKDKNTGKIIMPRYTIDDENRKAMESIIDRPVTGLSQNKIHRHIYFNR